MDSEKWNGFDKKEFEFEGRHAIIVFPKEAEEYYKEVVEYEEEEEQNPLMGDPQFKACQNLSGGI